MWLWEAQKSRYVCGVEGGPVSWCSEFEDWGKATSSYDFILVASGFKMPCESIGYTTVLTKQEKGVTSSRPATTGPARPRNTAGWWWQRGSRSDRPDLTLRSFAEIRQLIAIPPWTPGPRFPRPFGRA